MKQIGVIGLWHQGIVGAACLSDMGHSVVASDLNKDVIYSLKNAKSPIYEPGLDDLLSKGIKQQKLVFTTDLIEATVEKEAILLMIDTPVDENDISDISSVIDAVKTIAPVMNSGALLYITSQIPVGTSDIIKGIIDEANPSLEYYISYSPENLRLGTAIERFVDPPLPVIGCDSETGFKKTTELFCNLKKEWLHVELKSAEMLKHALNAFLATSVSYGNEIGNICDELGVNGFEVTKALKMEERVGNKAMILPGLGFSGGTLARDVQTLRNFGKQHDLPTIFFDGIWEANKHQNDLVLRKLKKAFGSLDNKKVCVLGLTYKPDTSTLRRSASIEIIKKLLLEGAVISSHDPKADEQELRDYSKICFSRDFNKAVEGCEAIVLMTPWKDYKEIDFSELKTLVMANTIILDTANLWNADSITEQGFTYLNIGQGRKI